MKWKTNRREDYDVVVSGGGTAGVFAAIAASKCGAKTKIPFKPKPDREILCKACFDAQHKV